MCYRVVCEAMPGVLADGMDDLGYAISVSEVKAEEVWEERGVSLYCVVKDYDDRTHYAVRYKPHNGGTFYRPKEHYQLAEV